MVTFSTFAFIVTALTFSSISCRQPGLLRKPNHWCKAGGTSGRESEADSKSKASGEGRHRDARDQRTARRALRAMAERTADNHVVWNQMQCATQQRCLLFVSHGFEQWLKMAADNSYLYL